MPAQDGPDTPPDKSRGIVSSRPAGQRTKPLSPANTPGSPSLSVDELIELARRLVGLTVAQAQELIADAGPSITLDLLDESQRTRAIFRFNHVKAYVRDGLVVDASPG